MAAVAISSYIMSWSALLPEVSILQEVSQFILLNFLSKQQAYLSFKKKKKLKHIYFLKKKEKTISINPYSQKGSKRQNDTAKAYGTQNKNPGKKEKKKKSQAEVQEHDRKAH